MAAQQKCPRTAPDLPVSGICATLTVMRISGSRNDQHCKGHQYYDRTAPIHQEHSRDRPRSRLGILVGRQLTTQITIRRSCHLLLQRTHRGCIVGSQKIELVGRELGFESLLRTVDGELDDQSVCSSDVECAEGGFMMPRDLDPHQFLQVHVLTHRWRFLHLCRVVDGGDVEFGTPVPLLIAFAEDFVADALDVGVGLQLYYAFP